MFLHRIAAIITAVAIGGGLMAVTAPTADAASRGTVTRAEAKKVVSEAMRQKQLTKNEVRKIVHGNGDLSEEDSGWECDTWIDEQAERAQDRDLAREQAWLESYGEEDGDPMFMDDDGKDEPNTLGQAMGEILTEVVKVTVESKDFV